MAQSKTMKIYKENLHQRPHPTVNLESMFQLMLFKLSFYLYIFCDFNRRTFTTRDSFFITINIFSRSFRTGIIFLLFLQGKFAVIMADPPWDIHMELPYGTMSDDEMRQLGIPQLQDDGLIFLWVTGRAMELGRECLKLWGYERVDEIIWVKTNQLQRIIRTGRTGHWLNHGKEHCLVGMKGSPQNLNRGLDSDVIVAEVRATSHKPDEIYGKI